MGVLIIGATGKIGRLTLDKALNAGHEVTTFERSPDWLNIAHKRLHKVQGNVINKTSLDIAMPEQEAVITVFGAPLNWFTRSLAFPICVR